MSRAIHILLKSPEKTHAAGKSLANSLYGSVDIFLSGELGAGKTVFLKGLAEGLGIQDHVTSPTYALEQRYKTKEMGPFIHMDLYRLNEMQAEEMMLHSDEHTGIRCIEWAERITKRSTGAIHIDLQETKDVNTRALTIIFDDIALPTSNQIEQWRKEVHLPENVIEHCEAVADICMQLAQSYCIENGTIVRTDALKCAGQLHDLLRFIDFHPGSSHLSAPPSTKKTQVWETLKTKYSNMGHESAVAEFLIEKGFETLAEIIRPHGLRLEPDQRQTIEQKLLFYGDKRAMQSTTVTLDERFADFKERYCDGKENPQHSIWYNECKRLEKELFPEGEPRLS